MDHPQISVVMPCLNEEQTIGACIQKAWEGAQKTGLPAEVIVVDNGSTDRSIEVAKQNGARVIEESRKGYGSAYLRGFKEAQGKFIVMGDSDDTYDFRILDQFIAPLQQGFELVNGNRLGGKILKDAMPALHRYIGVPFLSWFLNKLFDLKVSDAHCGLRSLKREILTRLDLNSSGMEFASEMLIKAGLVKIKMTEVPITYYPRKGQSKLRTFRDGLRHLNFMTQYGLKLFIFRVRTFGRVKW